MPLLVSAVVRTGWCHDSCCKSDCGDCDDQCDGCYDSEGCADDRPDRSVLLKGLLHVVELELSVHSKVVCILACLHLLQLGSVLGPYDHRSSIMLLK